MCPTCGADVAKPPKGRKKCTSCGVHMFVIVVDRSRRRLVTETEMQRHGQIESARQEKGDAAADRQWRAAAKAAGLEVARNEDEATSLDVVGESHYQRDLASLMAALRSRSDAWDVDTAALLVREPDNRYDRNAVRVLVHGRLVGYLSRGDAEGAQPWLKRRERSGTPVFVAANIGGGRRDESGYIGPIGVTLDELPETAAG